MKNIIKLLPALAIFAYFTLTSSAGGSSTNMTGSGGDTTGCGGSGCHGKRNASIITAVYLEDSSGNPVYTYRPGTKYLIKYTSFHSNAGTYPKFGFQMVTLNKFGAQAGKYNPATIPAGTMLDSSSSSGRVIFEQHNSLSPSIGSGDIGTYYTTTIGWTAPPVGTDTVKIYSITCLVDNHSDTSGDIWNRSVYRLPEETFVAVGGLTINTVVKAWPNPATNQIHLFADGVASGDYSLQVYDLAGANVANSHVAGNELNTFVIDASAWPAGMYNLVISGNGTVRTIPVIKQ